MKSNFSAGELRQANNHGHTQVDAAKVMFPKGALRKTKPFRRGKSPGDPGVGAASGTERAWWASPRRAASRGASALRSVRRYVCVEAAARACLASVGATSEISPRLNRKGLRFQRGAAVGTGSAARCSLAQPGGGARGTLCSPSAASAAFHVANTGGELATGMKDRGWTRDIRRAPPSHSGQCHLDMNAASLAFSACGRTVAKTP